MIKVILTKLESSHNNVRTPEIKGLLQCPPEIGKSLIVLSEPLDQTKDVRVIKTTPVESIKTHFDDLISYVVITTANSKYKIEYL